MRFCITQDKMELMIDMVLMMNCTNVIISCEQACSLTPKEI
jgi:hypothetical protein